jgi:hypothetical protein
MDGMLDPHDRRLAEAWETLKAHYDNGDSLKPESNRLAFADPEFLLRRETRGLRMQLEMLKADLAQKERGIEHTVIKAFTIVPCIKLKERIFFTFFNSSANIL